MKTSRTLWLTVIAFIFFITTNAQSTRYVDPTGTDSGNCLDASNACATIDYAMSVAGSGDTIEIASGVYTEQLEITKDLNIQGAGASQPGGTIIQAAALPNQATGSVITVDGNYNVQISGLTIRHGVGNNGGGLYNIDADLTLTDIVFTENTANYGGGMYNDSGNITLANVDFLNNTSVESGGGLNNYTPNEIITLNNVIFTDNTAGNAAGGVALYGGDTVFNNVTFNNNVAQTSVGGGLYVSNTLASFSDVIFTSNEAQGGGAGGAVFIEDSPVNFNNSIFTANKSGQNGGAILAESCTLSFTNATFLQNEAAQVGGGMFVVNSEITLFDALFEDNIAEVGGGLIFSSTNYNTVLIQNTHFNNNEATGNFGGGFANEGGIATLVNNLFTENKVAGAGGAIVNAGELHLINNTITLNEAITTGAGGVYNLTGQVTMTNSIVWGNMGPEAPDIANVDEFTANYSLYDDSDIFNDGNFSCDNCLTVAPNFEDAAGGDYRLSNTSPAVDSGDPNTDMSLFPTDGNNTPIDLDGYARVYNNIIDMGAFEKDSNLSVGNNPVANNQITGYPNPVNDIFYIESEKEISGIILYAITGQVLQVWEDKNSINLSAYPKGVYLAEIQTALGKNTLKIIKQ